MRVLATFAFVGLLAFGVFAFSNSDEGESFNPGGVGAGASVPEPAQLAEAPPNLGAAPELVDIEGWLQTDATSLDQIDAPVKIVQFWTFGCYNCKNTIPFLQDIHAKYRLQGLEIIGVHAPEFDYESDPEAIAEAAVELGVTWPIALDTEKKNFRSWQSPRRFWPRTFVLDSDGNIRFDRIGEGAYEELEATVAYLLAEAAAL